MELFLVMFINLELNKENITEFVMTIKENFFHEMGGWIYDFQDIFHFLMTISWTP